MAIHACAHARTHTHTRTQTLACAPACTCAQAKALSGDGKGGTALGLAQANFGPKYEQHVAQLQKSLEDAHKKLEALQREVDEARWGMGMRARARARGLRALPFLRGSQCLAALPLPVAPLCSIVA